MNATLTITVTPDLLDVLQTFAKGFKSPAPAAPAVAPLKAATGAATKQKPAETVPAAPAPAVATPEAAAATTISIEQVRAAVHAKTQAGKKAEVKALLGEFGVEKVTALTGEQYPEFLQKVNAL